MKGIKNIISIMLITLLLFTTFGCGKSEGDSPEEEADEGIKIGMCFDSFVIERWITDRDVFVSTAEAQGASVIVQSANADVETQVQQIQYLIDEKVDVIVVIPIDVSALSDILVKAKEEGIKVISYDRLCQNSDVDLYISFDNRRVGYLMADAIVSELPEGGNIYMIAGPETDNNADSVVEGFEERINGTNLKVTYKTRLDSWDASLGYTAIGDALQKNPDVDAIMCGNDDIATQVFIALSENRLAGEVLLTGQDSDLAACQRIVKGTQLMTVFKSFEKEAETAAEYAIKLAKGEDVSSDTINDGIYDVPYIELAPQAVTIDNIDEVIINSGTRTHDEVYMDN
ncbi:MAG: substrate-binding domain-containing protein [Eubacterium sp.]|nr:substrate-binding domain-containing protein [Eubacterium sp.]